MKEAEGIEMTHTCYEDNQGMCHNGCGHPMNFDSWVCYCYGWGSRNEPAVKAEWDQMVKAWEAKQ